jgi:transposase-like protein
MSKAEATNQPSVRSTRQGRSRGPETKARVLQLAESIGSVSRACQIMGYSRDSFYRFKRLYEEGGLAALEGPTRRKPLLKNRVASDVEQGVVELSRSYPEWGRAKVAETLAGRGLKISPSGVRCVWVRHGLETSSRRRATARANESRTPAAAE